MSSLITFNIPVEHIHPHPDNPRKDLGDLTELTESIRKNGIMQNLSVIPIEGQEDEYMLVIGHRRCAAAKAAGLKELPCRIIDNLEYREQLAVMLEENMQRNDLTIIEQAESFQMMLDLGEDIDTLASKTGFSKQTIKHRVELAKLDKKLLSDKARNESFQMSIKDMMILEKIPDVNERNRILKEADNSSQLSWKVDSSIREAKRENRKKEIVELLEENGITQVPKKFEKERYSGKWETIKWISLDGEDDIKLPKNKKDIYWNRSFSNIELVKEKHLTKKESAAKEAAKRKDAIHRDITKLERELDGYIRQFVLQIADGHQAVPKSLQTNMIKDLWQQMIHLSYCSVQLDTMVTYYTGLSLYNMTEEKKVENREKILKLPMLTQMVMCAARELKENTPLSHYDNSYQEENSKKYKDFIDLLEGYGFSLKPEYKKFIDGTHELFIAE